MYRRGLPEAKEQRDTDGQYRTELDE